jgi:hypothetical protein
MAFSGKLEGRPLLTHLMLGEARLGVGPAGVCYLLCGALGALPSALGARRGAVDVLRGTMQSGSRHCVAK